MTTRPRRLAAALALTAALVAAVALPATASALTRPSVTITQLSSTVHEQADGSVVLITAAEVADDAKLPATVSLPIPSGAKIDWAGEILGGDPSKDPTLDYTIEHAGAYDLAVMTITEGREAQVEISDPAAVTIDGDKHTVEATLPVPYEVGEARIALRVPPGGKLVSTDPKAVAQPGPESYTYYPVSRISPKPGTVLTAKLVYTGGSAPTQGGASGGSSSGTPAAKDDGSGSTVGLLLVAGIVVVIALVAVIRLGKKRSAEDADEEPADDEEDEVVEEEDADEPEIDDTVDDGDPAEDTDDEHDAFEPEDE